MLCRRVGVEGREGQRELQRWLEIKGIEKIKKKWLIKFVRDEIELCCCAEGLGECGTPTKSLCDEANED